MDNNEYRCNQLNFTKEIRVSFRHQNESMMANLTSGISKEPSSFGAMYAVNLILDPETQY